jgi:hypothetical protein
MFYAEGGRRGRRDYSCEFIPSPGPRRRACTPRSPKPSAALSGLDAPGLSLFVFVLPSHTPESTSIIHLTVDPPPPPTPVLSRSQPLAEYNCPICFYPSTRAMLLLREHVCCGECLFTAMKQRRHSHVVDPRTNTAKYVLFGHGSRGRKF